MGLRDLIGGGLQSVSDTLARDSMATVNGRSFPVVVSAIDRTKAVEVDGFMNQESAPFSARKADLAGHSVNSLQGEILTFEGRSYRIAQVFDNGLSFTLRCTAKDQAK